MRVVSQALYVLVGLLIGTGAHAAVFSNEYLTFNIPDDWTCSQTSGNWVCENKNALQKRVSIITVSAKVAGPTDNLESFRSYLSNPRSHRMGSNMPVMSQVLKVSPRQIQGWNWIHGTHLGSEIKDFYTIYLATVKNGLAVMMTLSAEKGNWTRYQPIYESMIASAQLRNFAPPQKAKNGDPKFDNMGGGNQQQNLQPQAGQPLPKGTGMPKIYVYGLALAFVILGAAVFIFLKGP